jgi:hypothetical protein
VPGAFETSGNAVGNFSNVFVYDLGLDYYAKYSAQVRAVTEAQDPGRSPGSTSCRQT